MSPITHHNSLNYMKNTTRPHNRNSQTHMTTTQCWYIDPQDVLYRYHITNHCTYKTTHSNTTRLRVQCVQHVCSWKFQAILRTRDQVWEIRKVEGVHTCATQLITQDHRHLSSRIIFQHVRQMVEWDPSTPIATIISSIETSMGYNTTYRKAWLVK